jgi:DNA-binding GntR family transcriptional regulator
MTLARGDSPLFRRISSQLADAIARGDYPVGSQLPTEFTLMRMFGASRFTIREALAELRARGLIASRRGLGSVVLRNSRSQRSCAARKDDNSSCCVASDGIGTIPTSHRLLSFALI